jgi:hypothetical protein
MTTVTVIPYSEQYTVVTEDETTAVVVTNSVVVTGNTDLTGYYTKVETDTLLDGKTDVGHQHVVADITDFNTAFINGGAF